MIISSRTCIMCGADISHRPWNAVYCEECSKVQRLRNQLEFHRRKIAEIEAKLENAKPLTSLDTQEAPGVESTVKPSEDTREKSEEREEARRTVIHTNRKRGRPPKPMHQEPPKEESRKEKAKASKDARKDEDDDWWD